MKNKDKWLKGICEFISGKWRKIIAKIFSIPVIIFGICNFYILMTELWKNNFKTNISLVVLLLYLYPPLYSFFTDIRKKDKEILEIIKNSETNELDYKLQSLEYYTVPQFLALILRHFSTFFIFIFVQLSFLEMSELVTINSMAMMQVYIWIIILSLVICSGAFGLGMSFSEGISFYKKGHVKHIMNVKEQLIKKAKMQKLSC